MHHPLRLIGLALLVGCPPPEPTLLPSPAERFDDATVVDWLLDGGEGDLTGRATVRAVNSHAAAVPADEVQVRADGVATTVGFDATGFGSVRFDIPGVHTAEREGTSVEVHVYPESFTAPDLSVASPAGVRDPVEAGDVGQGAIVRTATEVWWVARGGAPMRVFTSEDPILEMRTHDIDVDGTTDAVLWTDTEVFLLRGRPGGGMAWGGGFRAIGMLVGGVDVGDVSGDNLADVAIAWRGGDTGGVLDVWEGDGQWSFFAAYARNLEGEPTGVAINDATNDGSNQVTVGSSLGAWSRFVMIEHQMVPVGPLVPFGTLDLSATVVPYGDTNGDAGDELSFQVRDDLGQVVDMTLFNLLGTAPNFDPTRFTWNSPTGAFWDAADADGDGYTDLFQSDDTPRINVVTYSSDTSYTMRSAGDLPEPGPIAVRDWNGDELADLFLAGNGGWRFYEGTDRTTGVEGLPWGIALPSFDVVTNYGGGPTLSLPAAPGTARILTFEHPSAGTTIARVLEWYGEFAYDDVVELDTERLSDTRVNVLEAIQCGNDVFVLLEGVMVRLAYNSALGTLTLGATRITESTGITCGDGPGAAIAAVAGADTVITLNAALTQLTATPTKGAADVAFADLGAGVVAQACVQPRCSITAFQAGAGGPIGFFETSAAGSQWTDATGAHPLAGAFSWTSVQDVDGNGTPELLAATADGTLGVYRGTGASLVGPRTFLVYDVLQGAPLFLDADFDGIPDLWYADPEGDLKYSRSAPEVTGTTPTSSPTSTDTGTPPTGSTN